MDPDNRTGPSIFQATLVRQYTLVTVDTQFPEQRHHMFSVGASSHCN